MSALSSRYCSMLSVNEWMLSLTDLYPSLRDSSGKSHSAISSNIMSAQWDIVNKANTVSKSHISLRFIINSSISTSLVIDKRILAIFRSKTSIFYSGFMRFLDFLFGIGIPTPSKGVMDSGTTWVFCMASSAVTDTSAFASSSD